MNTRKNTVADLEAELEQLRLELAWAMDKLTGTEQAYARFVPRQLLQLLSLHNIRDIRLGAQAEFKMSILFSDIRDFTTLSESLTPQQNFNFLNSYLSQMEPVISTHRGIIDKYIGDAIMALFPGTTDDAVNCALGMLARLQSYNENRSRAQYQAVRIGIGINTGIVMLGTIGGSDHLESTVIGDAVNLASRLEHLTKEYGVQLLVSEHTINDLAQPEKFRLRFIDRLMAKGKREAQAVYEIFDADPEPLRSTKLATLSRFEKALAYYHLNHIAEARKLLEACHAEAPEDKPARIYLERCNRALRGRRQDDRREIELIQPWFEEYQCGVAQFDEEHKELLQTCHVLLDAVKTGRSAKIREAMELLARQSEEHFEHEEKLMLESRYPFLMDHSQQHRRFLGRVAALSDEATAPLFDPLHFSFRIKLTVLDWVVNHSVKFDRHLGNHLKQNGLSS